VKVSTKKKLLFGLTIGSVCIGMMYAAYVSTHRDDPNNIWYAAGLTAAALLNLYVMGRLYDSIVAGYIKCEECGTVLKKDRERSTDTHTVAWCPRCGWYYGFDRKKP
jgi:hypothetical protein